MLFSQSWMKLLSRISLTILGPCIIGGSLWGESVVFNIGPDPSGTDSVGACGGLAPGAGCQVNSGLIMTTGIVGNTGADVRNDSISGSIALNSYAVYRDPNTAPYPTAVSPAKCDRCQLSFNSGDRTSYTGSTTGSSFDWVFGTSGPSALSLKGVVFGAPTPPIPTLVTSSPLTTSQKLPATLSLPNTGAANNYIDGAKGTLTLLFNLPANSLNSGLLNGLGLTSAFAGKPLVAQLILNFTAMGFGTSGHAFSYDLDRGIMKSYSEPFGDARALSGTLSISTAPEPISLVFVGSGLLLVGFLGKRRAAKG